MDEYEEYTTPSVPPPRPPKVNINVFVVDENIGLFPDEIFDGKMGPLPLLISVNVGYYPDDLDPFMYHYESQEMMFAFKKDAQKRVLIRDGHDRTLSLPLHSTLPFFVGRDSKEMTMDQIVASQPLPVSVRFAHGESMDLTVDKRAADYRFFGSFLKVTAVYDEPYIWCLPLEPNGTLSDKPIVLPRNLKSAGFSPVVGIAEVNEPAEALKGFVKKYSELASKLDFQADPFFQELAFVNRGTEPVDVDDIKPYIDETTFIPIRMNRRPAPQAPSSGGPPPPPPPRTPHHHHHHPEKKREQGGDSSYSSISHADVEEHIYNEIKHLDMTSRTNVDKPLMNTQGTGKPSVAKSPDSKTAPNSDPRDAPCLPERNLSTEGASSETPKRYSGELMKSPVVPQRVVKSHLKSLSVEDVAGILKALGLSKHTKRFQKNRIDGVLLQKITKKDMISEFSMTPLECLKLQTFITDGHIPQTAKSKN